MILNCVGGEGEIRTHGTREGSTVFQRPRTKAEGVRFELTVRVNGRQFSRLFP
jgi:hypothetical protein